MAAPILVQNLGVQAGDFGVVQYNVPGPPIFHERLVLAKRCCFGAPTWEAFVHELLLHGWTMRI